MPALNPGDPFPALDVALRDGHTLRVPDDLAGDFAVVLFFRGAWCPYCNAQLRAFQRAQAKLTDAGIRTVALSVDDEPTTRKLVDDLGLGFDVGHGADAAQLQSTFGAFVNPDPTYVQSTGFVLDPSGSVVVSVYSSGAIGRLAPDDVVGLVRYLREQTRGAGDPSPARS